MVWLVIDPGRLTPFVRNRIVQIEESNIGASWKHVQSCESPADVISRGCEPRQLLANTLWWHGPDFLRTSDIPDGSFQVPEVLPDIRTETKSVVVAHVLTSGKGNFFDEFSSFDKTIRVRAYVLRFIRYTRKPKLQRMTGNFTVNELEASFKACAKAVQIECFPIEIQHLTSTKTVQKDSSL